MSHGLFPRIKTNLDLNGPNLSFTQQPVDVTATSIGQDVTLTGIATASFPPSNPNPSNTGSIAYQWYLTDGTTQTPLVNSSKFSGTTTSSLTIKNTLTQFDDGKQYFVRADYVPSEDTGNAYNEPLDSNTVTVSVPFELKIITQPQNQEVSQFIDAKFTVSASITSNVTYQWCYEWPYPSDYRYYNKETRTGQGGFNQKPSCIGISNGWYTRTGAPESDGSSPDIRRLQIFWDSTTPVYDGPYAVNEDGYVIVGKYAYKWENYKSPSEYGWRYDDTCGVGDANALPFATGDYGNGFDICRYEYEYQQGAGSIGGIVINDSSTISGSKTNELTISSADIGVEKLFCRLTHPNALPSPLNSSIATFTVRDAKAILNWEQFGGGSSAPHTDGSKDLTGGGKLSFRANTDSSLRTLCVYSREKDFDVKVTMGAASGRSVSGNSGGEGGVSVFKMKIKKNEEYLIKMGVTNSVQTGGPKGGLNGGGGLIVIYHKYKAVAVCGGGGGAGTSGRGGDGGGLGNPGDSGGGRNAGVGGVTFSPDGLPSDGQTQAGRTAYNQWDGSNTNGGRLGGCTLGRFWHLQGKTPCEDLGNIQFYDGGGTINPNTATLYRGFKDGQGFRNNGGGATGNQGGGGGGATGGSAGTSDGAGGGGGSGYRASEIELISSTTLPGGTQTGGNTGVSFITFELYDRAVFDDNLGPSFP